MPDDPPPLPLGGAAPDALPLAVGQCVLEARLADRALGADGLGLGGVGLVLCDRVEDLDVETPAGTVLAPRGGTHERHFLWKIGFGSPPDPAAPPGFPVPAPNSAEQRVWLSSATPVKAGPLLLSLGAAVRLPPPGQQGGPPSSPRPARYVPRTRGGAPPGPRVRWRTWPPGPPRTGTGRSGPQG